MRDRTASSDERGRPYPVRGADDDEADGVGHLQVLFRDVHRVLLQLFVLRAALGEVRAKLALAAHIRSLRRTETRKNNAFAQT